jgi:adenine-specific DNA-methyltransferase
MINKVKDLGQVFTQTNEVEFMLSLRKNAGRVLEPSVGEGAFWNAIPECVGIEYDSDVCPDGCLNMDFFDYPITEKFPTIIANPPYVRGKGIQTDTRSKLTSSLIPIKGNLYLHFIEKMFHHLEPHGEMILINPMDILNSHASAKLLDMLLANGTITHMYDRSGENIFKGANPDSCCIWRYEKDNTSRECETNTGRKRLIHHTGNVFITNNTYSVPFSDLFYIKVGAVPGQGEKYFDTKGSQFVYSKTRVTEETRGMNYVPGEWVRSKPSQDDAQAPRIYVNCKTLTSNPFFTHPCRDWDGAILAIFPRFQVQSLQSIVDAFNAVDWNDIGFMWHGKYVFASGRLTNSLLPPTFEQFYDPDPLLEF